MKRFIIWFRQSICHHDWPSVNHKSNTVEWEYKECPKCRKKQWWRVMGGWDYPLMGKGDDL